MSFLIVGQSCHVIILKYLNSDNSIKLLDNVMSFKRDKVCNYRMEHDHAKYSIPYRR